MGWDAGPMAAPPEAQGGIAEGSLSADSRLLEGRAASSVLWQLMCVCVCV